MLLRILVNSCVDCRSFSVIIFGTSWTHLLQHEQISIKAKPQTPVLPRLLYYLTILVFLVMCPRQKRNWYDAAVNLDVSLFNSVSLFSNLPLYEKSMKNALNYFNCSYISISFQQYRLLAAGFIVNCSTVHVLNHFVFVKIYRNW